MGRMTPREISRSVAPARSVPNTEGRGVPSAGWLDQFTAGFDGSRRAAARVYIASAPVTRTTSRSPREMARQASWSKAWGALPPMAVRTSSGGMESASKPSLAATRRAGLTERHASGTTTRMLSARRIRAFPAAAGPPGAAPVASSAAARKARAINSTGSGRSAGSVRGSGGIVTWPTPTTTGVWGWSAMRRGSYRLTPRAPPARSVDSRFHARRLRLGPRRSSPPSRHRGLPSVSRGWETPR